MDMSQYLDTFLVEAREHLQKLERGLLELEKTPDNKRILDDIFRSAHTLKGMSATMGFNNVAELTHEIENILHKLRSNEVLSSIGIINLLFKSLDLLNIIISEISDKGCDEHSVEQLLEELRSFRLEVDTQKNEKSTFTSVVSVQFNQYEKNLLKQAIDQGFNCYHLVVHINPKTTMKSARAYMVFKNIERVGEIVKSIPTVPDIEEERFEDFFELVVISRENTEVIRNSLISLTEVEEPEINNLTDIVGQFSAEEIKTEPGLRPEENHCHGTKVQPSHTVRVDKSKLDSLMNLVGELVINKTRVEQIYRVYHLNELGESLEQMNRVASELQDLVMKIRMMPVDNVFARFPRMIRDLTQELGKEIELIIDGAETELDRTVIDEIGDPLVHLLRNAVGHGIEQPDIRINSGKDRVGRITLSARQEGNNVIIEIHDDGKGIDPVLVKNVAVGKGLISSEAADELDEKALMYIVTQPGFTTSEAVTDISGRGVGLDVVQNRIESLGGNLQIYSTPGKGTKFTIQLPVTLAIIQSLLVVVGTETYAIPLSFIAETTSIFSDEIERIQGQEFVLFRGDVLPLKRLTQLFQVPEGEKAQEPEVNIVIVTNGQRKTGLVVDRLIGQQDIVLKPLDKLFGEIPVIGGTTILGNGEVSLVVDVAGLLQEGGNIGG